MDNQNNQTITSANASLFLTVPGLYDSPVKIENFSSDAMVSAAQVNPVVAEMGVDGHLSVGYSAECTENKCGNKFFRKCLHEMARH